VLSHPFLCSQYTDAGFQAKILPLRLHVDQDALDFLKHFFAFAPPAAERSSDDGEEFEAEEAPPKAEPFFRE
jgi:autophagy-related protein 2